MEITDLPLDVLMLIFGHLPLVEVLKRVALVNRAFYKAHTAYCRSYVNQITLFGNHMTKEMRSQDQPTPRTADQFHQYLFTLARRQPMEVPSLNPRSSQLFLSAEFEVSKVVLAVQSFFCLHFFVHIFFTRGKLSSP